MPVLYKPFQSVLEDKNKKKLFHPRVIYTANVSTAQLAKEIAAYSSLSTGDVKNTLDNLVTVSAQHLQASESVTLDGFGTFRMVMKSNGKGVEVPEKVSAAQASLTVRFLPNYTKNPEPSVSVSTLPILRLPVAEIVVNLMVVAPAAVVPAMAVEKHRIRQHSLHVGRNTNTNG